MSTSDSEEALNPGGNGHQTDCEEAERPRDLDKHSARFMRRRRLMLAAVVAIFVVAGTVMVVSVIYDTARNHHKGYTEFSCAESDLACQQLLCPEGHSWRPDQQMCAFNKGHTCCVDRASVKRCWNETVGEDGFVEHDCVEAIGSAGVAPSAYKQLCRDGYLWVKWRGKCLRKE